MSMNRVFTAEHNRHKVQNTLRCHFPFASLFSVVAHADEEGGDPTPTVNFEQAIALARKEEKDKLYPQLTKLKEENKSLSTNLNTQLLKVAELQTKIDELSKKDDGSEKIAELTAQVTALTTERDTLKNTAPKEEEIRAQVEKEYEVKYYRDQKIAENRDSLLEVFDGEVTGSTKEEVDAAINAVKEKTLNVYRTMGMVDDEGNIVKPSEKKEKKKTPAAPTEKPATPPVVNPQQEEETFDADYVRNLDPRSKEYADWRKKMGLK